MKDSIISIEIDIPDLAKRDNCIQNMEKMIQEKKNFIIEKRNRIQEEERENEFLRAINKDYEKYYHYIVNEKNKQVRFMDGLTEYIGKMIREGELTEEDLKRAEWEQQKIMMEITSIRDELNQLTKKIE
jgi:uncharacterized protein (DUF3084 family)